LARVLALAPDLFFASKIKETLTAAEHDVELTSSVADTLGAAGEAQLVIVDLHAEGLDPAQLVARLGGKPLLGFYSHIDVDTRAQATQAGFDLVVPRSRMARDMPNLVSRLLDG
jgi:acetylornithine deacetylase/succinyl-diaminopimelate desuccinylase-like protein